MYYQTALQTELEGSTIIADFIRLRTGNQPLAITDREQQKTIGDFLIASQAGSYSLELKVERKFTGNLFIESWSNREWGNPGWLFTSKANRIAFYFLDQDILITVDLHSLRSWLLNKANPAIDKFTEVAIKADQRNDTRGYVIPIQACRDADLLNWSETNPRRELANAG